VSTQIENRKSIMANNALVGTWDLVSLFGESTEGETWLIYGENPSGMLIYTAEGTMTVLLMKQGRPAFTGDLNDPAPEVLREAFFGFDAYGGTYTLDPHENKITHHIIASRLPNWEGSEQVRYYELVGDTLTIRSAPIPARGTEWVVHLVWKRHS
jgi:hypothetical protein